MPYTFSAKTYCVAENGYLSQTLKFAIATNLKKAISMKDIPQRYLVAAKTVEGEGLLFLKNHDLSSFTYPNIID